MTFRPIPGGYVTAVTSAQKRPEAAGRQTHGLGTGVLTTAYSALRNSSAA